MRTIVREQEMAIKKKAPSCFGKSLGFITIVVALKNNKFKEAIGRVIERANKAIKIVLNSFRSEGSNSQITATPGHNNPAVHIRENVNSRPDSFLKVSISSFTMTVYCFINLVIEP